MKDRVRSSRRRYAQFVDDYRHRRLDETGTGRESGGAKTASPKRREYLREYLRWLAPHKRTVALVMTLALAVAGLEMIEPLFMRFIVDRVLLDVALRPAQRLAWLHAAGAAFLVVILLSNTLHAVRDYRQRLLNVRVMLSLRQSIFERLVHLPLPRLWDMKTGGILSRLTGDVDTTTGLLQMAIVSPSTSVVRLVIALFILISLNWRLAMMATAIIPGAMIMSFVFARRVRPIYRVTRKDVEQIDGRVGETFSGIRVVQGFRARDARARRVHARTAHRAAEGALRPPARAGAVDVLGTSRQRRERRDRVVRRLPQRRRPGLDWRHHGVSVVHVSAAESGLEHRELLLGAAALAGGDGAGLRGARDGGRQARSPGCQAGAGDRRRRFEFEGVEFEYREGRPVVRDFDLKVAGGTVVALVGRSGAGKTTVTDLVARFHDPTRGRILLNGIDIRDLRLRSYRDLLAIVQQDVFLFDGSVRDNIAYGRHDATDAEVEDAARRANAHEFIERLPDGYDTFIGERGVKLSGGQQQRLAIARAILEVAADPDPRRGDQQPRHRERAADSGVDGRAAGGPHDVRHRPPPVDRAPRER